MILVEQHIIKRGHNLYDECADITGRNKNLYNAALYIIRQHYFKSGQYIGFKTLFHSIKNDTNYTALPRKISNQTLKMAHNAWIGWFKSLKSYSKNPEKFKAKPKMPKYNKGLHQTTIYEKQALSKKAHRKQLITLSQSNINIKTNIIEWNQIKEARITVGNNRYIIEVVYEKAERTLSQDSTTISAIDLGMDNLATIVHNDPNKKHFAINGKPAKSINQYYNKKLAKLKSKLPANTFTSKQIKQLTNKRNDKLKHFLHQASKELVSQLVEAGCSTLIIGKNPNMKQDITLNAKTAQNFINIPTHKFAHMVEYKATQEGITVKYQEESYTSKCSFLDYEPISKQTTYAGKRKHRGLFVGKMGTINADTNGGYNIMEKAVPGAIKDRAVMPRHPVILTVKGSPSKAGRGQAVCPVRL